MHYYRLWLEHFYRRKERTAVVQLGPFLIRGESLLSLIVDPIVDLSTDLCVPSLHLVCISVFVQDLIFNSVHKNYTFL